MGSRSLDKARVKPASSIIDRIPRGNRDRAPLLFQRTSRINFSFFFFFQAHMKFPPDYPYSPPSIRFMTKVWHPNVYEVSKYEELSILPSSPFHVPPSASPPFVSRPLRPSLSLALHFVAFVSPGIAKPATRQLLPFLFPFHRPVRIRRGAERLSVCTCLVGHQALEDRRFFQGNSSSFLCFSNIFVFAPLSLCAVVHCYRYGRIRRVPLILQRLTHTASREKSRMRVKEN